jgi:rhamnosyltransferase
VVLIATAKSQSPVTACCSPASTGLLVGAGALTEPWPDKLTRKDAQVGVHDRPYVSIILPTWNGMPLVQQCLEGVLRQETPWPFEVIVIDSSSTDGTWEFIKTLAVNRYRIHPSDFNHGGTRNLAASLAQGDFLVFLVQDAVPASRSWLARLVAACDAPGVAGAYSRQIARPDSTAITRYLMLETKPGAIRTERKRLPAGKHFSDLPPSMQFKLAAFDNVSSCIRRSIWIQHPFATIAYGEDIEWGKRVIEAGYTLVYEPASAVYHSHDRSAYYALKRAYADHYLASKLFGWTMVPSPLSIIHLAAHQTIRLLPHVWSSGANILERLQCALLTPLFTLAIAAGQFLGPQVAQHGDTQPWLYRLDQRLRKGV